MTKMLFTTAAVIGLSLSGAALAADGGHVPTTVHAQYAEAEGGHVPDSVHAQFAEADGNVAPAYAHAQFS